MTAQPDDQWGEIVPLHPDSESATDLTAFLTPEDRDYLTRNGWRPAVQRAAERYRLPSPAQARDAARWWGRHLLRLTPWLPIFLLAELKPICRGIGRTWVSWRNWEQATTYADTVRLADGKDQHRAQEKVETRRAARARASLIVVGLLLVGAVVLVWLYPLIAVAVGVVLLAVFDAVGRRGAEGAVNPVVLPQGPIAEGMPLSSLRAEIAQTFEATGVDVTVAQPLPMTNGWTVDYHSTAEITDEHLRQIERDLNIRRGGVTQIVDREGAARGQLQVMIVDPLGRVLDSPEYDDLTIYKPLPLGMTAAGQEWREHFLRTHFTVIGASQSGKSSCLWQLTDVLRRCPEVEMDAIDLTEGPAFGASRRAFRRRGFDEETAKEILEEAVALCKVRNAELNRRAEDDDTPDDYEEKWQPTAEHPQRVVEIDEFARVSENDELLPLVEYLLRYGAKAAVTVGIAGQGATLADFGTKTVRAQVMLKILFACDKQDVVSLLGAGALGRGYRPDLFEPANGLGAQDAGKCFAQSAASRIPEARRAYRLEQAEVRRRDRALGSRQAPVVEVEPETVEAVEVPQILVDFRESFAAHHDPDHLPTSDLLTERGWKLTAKGLANKVVGYGLRPQQHPVTKARGYYLADVEKAMADL